MTKLLAIKSLVTSLNSEVKKYSVAKIVLARIDLKSFAFPFVFTRTFFSYNQKMLRTLCNNQDGHYTPHFITHCLTQTAFNENLGWVFFHTKNPQNTEGKTDRQSLFPSYYFQSLDSVWKEIAFSNFSCMFLHVNLNFFFPIWILIVLIYHIWETSRNKLKIAFCYQKLFWLFTVWINSSSDLKIFSNSRPSV